VAIALLYFGIGGSAIFADNRSEAAKIVADMDKVEKTWKPVLKKLEENRDGSPARKAAIAEAAKRVREFLDLTATVKREAEKIRRGDESAEKIQLFGKHYFNWSMKLNEVTAAAEKLKKIR
jgi:hypothetical protein